MEPIPKCDIMLFVVTESEESALLQAAAALGIAPETRDGPLGEYHWLGQIGPNRVVAARTAMGPLGYKGSGSRAVHYVDATQATGVIAVGMAFGCDPSSQALGDVLVCTQLVPYDDRDVHSAGGAVVTSFTRVKRRRAKKSLVRMMEKHAVAAQLRVHFGALLSGGARIHCAAYRDELRGAVPQKGEPIIGGEMEGVGLLSASNPDDPNWLIVKGICDFADENRDAVIEEGRSAACANAAMFVLGALAARPT